MKALIGERAISTIEMEYRQGADNDLITFVVWVAGLGLALLGFFNLRRGFAFHGDPTPFVVLAVALVVAHWETVLKLDPPRLTVEGSVGMLVGAAVVVAGASLSASWIWAIGACLYVVGFGLVVAARLYV